MEKKDGLGLIRKQKEKCEQLILSLTRKQRT